MQKVCLIVPCYNEGKRLDSDQFSSFLKENTDFSFLFVNDGSTDATLEVLQELERKTGGQINILNIQLNVGKAEAVRKGILAAKEIGMYGFVGYLDADLAIPLHEVKRISSTVFDDHQHKAFFMSRVKMLGKEIDRKFIRHIFGRVLATVINAYYRLGVYDSQCGFKIFNADIVSKLFSEEFKTKWVFDIEVLLRIRDNDLLDKTIELSLSQWMEKGDSKIRIKDLLGLPIDLLKIFKTYAREK